MNSIKAVNKQLKDGLQSVLSQDKKNIIFLSHTLETRCAYGQLPNALMEKYNVIMIGAERVNDNFEKMGHAFVHIPCKVELQGEWHYTHVDNDHIDLIITADSLSDQNIKVNREFLSKKAKRLFVSSDLFSLDIDHEAFDCIAICSKYVMELCKKDKDLSQKAIEIGSLQLDDLIKRSEAGAMQHVVTYMPLKRPVPRSYVNMNFIAGHDNMLIEWLLAKTDMTFSYRLHQADIANPPHYYIQLQQQYRNEERVIFDEMMNDDYHITSETLLSDFSSNAYLFSLAMLRNAVYFIADAKTHKQAIDKAIEHRIVRVAHSMNDIVKYLTDSSRKEELLSIREQQIYHIGNAQSNIMEHITRILN